MSVTVVNVDSLRELLVCIHVGSHTAPSDGTCREPFFCDDRAPATLHSIPLSLPGVQQAGPWVSSHECLKGPFPAHVHVPTDGAPSHANVDHLPRTPGRAVVPIETERERERASGQPPCSSQACPSLRCKPSHCHVGCTHARGCVSPWIQRWIQR